MRAVERITVVLFAVVLAAFVAAKLYNGVIKDTTPPIITCDSDTIEIAVSEKSSALLQGVTAKDNRDGDLTDAVLIEGITQLITDDTAIVTYVVFDAADNMATCQRTVRYTDYEKPHFSLNSPLTYGVGQPVTLMDQLKATDSAGNDISDSIRVTAQNVNANYEGVYSVTVQVSNSEGDVESLTLPVLIDSESAETPLITLSDYIVYLDMGEEFRARSYIVSATSDGKSKVDSGNVKIGGDVDTDTPGTYEVFYTYQSYTVYQTVVVK